MSISANEYYVIECSRCKKEVSENAKICPHCGKDLDVMVDKTKEENEVSIGTDSVEEADFFKKHNMVRKTLSMFKEEQRSEFQTALNFIKKGAVKRGIFQLEKIMYEDGLKLTDEKFPLVLGEVYLEYNMTEECEKYINFINEKVGESGKKDFEIIIEHVDGNDAIIKSFKSIEEMNASPLFKKAVNTVENLEAKKKQLLFEASTSRNIRLNKKRVAAEAELRGVTPDAWLRQANRNASLREIEIKNICDKGETR